MSSARFGRGSVCREWPEDGRRSLPGAVDRDEPRSEPGRVEERQSWRDGVIRSRSREEARVRVGVREIGADSLPRHGEEGRGD